MDFATEVNTFSALMVLGAGLIAGFSPCTLPTAVLITGYVGGVAENKLRAFSISFSFVLGIVLALAALGVLAVVVGNIFVNIEYFNYLVAALLLTMGLWFMKIININIGSFMPFKVKKDSGVAGAFLLGLPFGILASPCTAPVLGAVLAYVATVGDIFLGFSYLLIFGLARSIPLLIVGTFAGALKTIKQYGVWQERIEYGAGIIMVILGLYYIWLG